jgi:hypothetical protein
VPLRPRPEDFAARTAQNEPSRSFEVVDFTGEGNEYQTEMEAMEALVQFIGGAHSLKVLEALIESNPALAAYPSIIEAYKDRKEALSNPGDRQDGPAASTQPSDSAQNSTTSAEIGQPEHPEEQGQPSTSTERRSASPVPQTENTNDPALRDEPKSLAVPVIKPVGGKTDCEAMKAKMLEVIAGLTDPADTARNGRFAQQNRASLQVMRGLSVDAWSTVQSQLEERDRQLRGGAP